MAHRRERGASVLLILLIMALLLVAFFAVFTLSRVSGAGDERADTQKRLAAAAQALQQYAAARSRLPCPADPAADTGAEVQATLATCTFGEGTLPWLALGLTREASLDAWGRKISYRVYTGNRGSLTQPGGASMVDCDKVEPTPGAATSVAGSLGGLCVANPDPFQRTTTPEKFLAGKGLTVNDYGVTHNDAAYVLISHGASGFGAYTTAGARLAMPNSAKERNNTRETGPFTIDAFSGADIEAVNAQHFDDLLVYATISDLVKRAGLEARDWPDTATSSITFDSATVSAAAGTTVTSGDVGAATLDFGSARVSGFSGATPAATDISYDPNTSGSATGGIGVAGNFSNLISNVGNEYLHIDFSQPGGKFAVTLDNFGTYAFGETFTEQVQFKFYLANTLVGSAITKSGCNADGGLASFSMTPTGPFDAVEIIPVAATGSSGGSSFSAFLVSEIKACAATAATCRTGLTTGANTCP
jgi:type II secretory pathway pseudopilin PulG